MGAEISLLNSFAEQVADAAATMKALSHEGRLLLMCHLSEAGELPAGALSARIGLSQSATSQHLALLRLEGLVATRREGQTVHYRIADPRVHRVLALLHELYCPTLGTEVELSQ